MDREALAAMWNRAAPIFDQSGPRLFADSGRQLVEFAQLAPGAEVLDVACGRGAVLFPVARQVGANGRVMGIDLSAEMVRQTQAEAAQAGLSNIELQQMDVSRLTFADASYDAVLCGHAIFYFPEAMPEFYRVLRPGGRLALTIFGQGSFDWLEQVLAAHSPPADSESEESERDLETAAGLESLFCQAGFEAIQVSEMNKVYDFQNEEAWWSLMWSIGVRHMMEQMDATELACLKADVFEALQQFRQEGFLRLPARILLARGRKSRAIDLNG